MPLLYHRHHMTVQSGDILDPRFKTLAEHMRTNGYRTTAFCNNPLVGVIANGFKRGFETFYNYGGAIQSVPAKPKRRVFTPFSAIWEWYTQTLRKIAYPIQNAFANSSRIFGAALNPFWVPLWTRFARFKGETPSSIRDVTHFLRQQNGTQGNQQFFLFFNLMETHLPFSAPERFIKDFAPSFLDHGPARDFMLKFNTQAARWFAPLDQPFPRVEGQIISDMYDAEVAYQDHLLAELLAELDRPVHRENTLVIFVADHGEMLGEHQRMGHGFGVYQELVHVPLFIRLPGQHVGQRISHPVSTTRLFHTMLEVAGVETYETAYCPAVDVKSQSLMRETNGQRKSQPTVFSEAYAPDFALTILEKTRPDLIKLANCRATHWAVYENGYKLIRVEDGSKELFSLASDPREMNGGNGDAEVEHMGRLITQLGSFLEKAGSHRPRNWMRKRANLDNELVRQRLRDLGYME